MAQPAKGKTWQVDRSGRYSFYDADCDSQVVRHSEPLTRSSEFLVSEPFGLHTILQAGVHAHNAGLHTMAVFD